MMKEQYCKCFLIINAIFIIAFLMIKTFVSYSTIDYRTYNYKQILRLSQINSEDGVSFGVIMHEEQTFKRFDQSTIQKINKDSSLDFIVSLENTFEDYQIMKWGLEEINVPVIIGANETQMVYPQSIRYNPSNINHYFSFNIDELLFIFLTSEEQNYDQVQEVWFKNELNESSHFKHTFVFVNENTGHLHDLVKKYNVSAIFNLGEFEVFNQLHTDEEVGYEAEETNITVNKQVQYLKVNINQDQQLFYDVDDTNHNKKMVVPNLLLLIVLIYNEQVINLSILISSLFLILVSIYYLINKERYYYRDFESTIEVKQDQKLCIAMFTNNYLPFIGGVPISINRLATGLMKRGHEVYIFAPLYPKTMEEDQVIRCKLICYYRGKEFDYAITNIFSSHIKHQFFEHPFDVIHVHHPFWMGTKGLKLGRKNGIPVIYTYHTRLEKYAHYLPFLKKTFHNLLSHKLIKRFCQKCDAIIAPTTSAKEYLENVGVSREKFVMPTGIDFERYHQLDDDQLEELKRQFKQSNELILCTVSRLSKEKNIDFLLDGLKRLKEQSNHSFKCLMIGDGPLKEDIQKRIMDYELQDYVMMLGTIKPEEMCYYYTLSDLFVFSSLSETQGMVILEAMAGGCPVVAIRSSGIDDVIDNGVNGYKTKADVIEWVDRILEIMKDQDLRHELAKQAYLYAAGHSVDQMAEKMETIYYKKVHQKAALIKHASVSKLKQGEKASE